MEIRFENPEDFKAVRSVNIAAFDRTQEADLVDALREAADVLSLVAIWDKQVIGHILFSPVSVESSISSNCRFLGLAPLAVMPKFQKQGVGSLLVSSGLKECFRLGFSAVVVLGEAKYYSRFSFVPAKTWGLICEYPVPDEAFMALELQSGALLGCSGTIRYRPEFAAL